LASCRRARPPIEKVGFLKELGADRLVLRDLPLAGLEHFARRMISRKPAALTRIKDPHPTIEVACFLRLTLLRADRRKPDASRSPDRGTRYS
jgi:hypothetical protein